MHAAATRTPAPWWFTDTLPGDYLDPADVALATVYDGQTVDDLPPVVTPELLAMLVEASDAADAGAEFLAPYPTLSGILAGVDADATLDLWPVAS